MRLLPLLVLLAACDRGSDPRVVLRIVTPATDPFETATSVRVTFDSDPPRVAGPFGVEQGISLDLPADAVPGRLVVEALDDAESVVGIGATPPIQPSLVAGLEIRVLVSTPLVPEDGPTPPPEPLGTSITPLGEEWMAVTTESGALLVYDLLLHEWITGVVEPPAPSSDATAVPLPDRAIALAGGPDGGIAIYEGLANAWRTVAMPDEATGGWIRPAAIACADGSTLFVGGGDGASGARDWVVRLAADGTASIEDPLALARSGMTASGQIVVGGAPGETSVEIVGCDGTREVVDGVAGADRTGHGAAALADGSVLVVGGEVAGAATDDAILLPADCAPGACDPISAGPLLPEPRANVALASLPEGGAVLLGAGGAISIDPDSWTATPLEGDALAESPSLAIVATGDLAAIDPSRLVFLAPRVLYEAPP